MAISHYMEGDLALNIARGLTRSIPEHKFGAVPAMSQNETGTVWDVNDTLYPWSAFDTAGVLTIPAVNASDNGSTVTVFGLDENYALQTEEFVASSSGTTTGTKTFKRVYRAFFTDEGSTNVGNIDVQRAGTTVLRITAGKAQTLMAVYTVPAGYTAYLMKGAMSCQAGADATGNMFVRYADQNSFRIGHTFEVSGTGGEYVYDFSVPIAIPEKSDIDIRATVRSNNARLTAAFDMILIPSK
jgi:zona occludens toxin (predicted ATPase)